MSKHVKVIIPFFIILFYCSANACSSFLLECNNRHILGKNYDWNTDNGRVLVNKRNMVKLAFGVSHPKKWTSKYGSVTFNQYGQEFPCGGMNEKGLVIEALWLSETTYPHNNINSQIDNIQWIQYQLDCSENIEEVINNNKSLVIHPVTPTVVHYFVSDRQGNCLVIEYLNGELKEYEPTKSDFKVLTNDPYDKSMRLIKKCKLFGGELDLPNGLGSIKRFIKISYQLNQNSKKQPVENAFEILKSVRLPFLTKWTIVYDIDSSKILFKTVSNRNIKTINLRKIDFECNVRLQYIDMRVNKRADVTDLFRTYSIKENNLLIEKSLKQTPSLKYWGKYHLKDLESFPTTLLCKEY